MLTGYQCQVVAFTYEGEILCPDCARAATSSVTIDKAERGLTTSYDIAPLIRYELDEYNGERAYEAAEERVRDFEDAHPVLALDFLYEPGSIQRSGTYHKLIDKLAEGYPGECCGSCGTELD